MNLKFGERTDGQTKRRQKMNGHRLNSVEDAMLNLIQRKRDQKDEPELKRLIRLGLTKKEALKYLRVKENKSF